MAIVRKPVPEKILPDGITSAAVKDVREAVKEIQTQLPLWTEATAVFPSATTIGVKHNLGRRATRYIVTSKTAPCDVSNGTDSTGRFPADTIFLAGSAAATVTLLVF